MGDETYCIYYKMIQIVFFTACTENVYNIVYAILFKRLISTKYRHFSKTLKGSLLEVSLFLEGGSDTR